MRRYLFHFQDNFIILTFKAKYEPKPNDKELSKSEKEKWVTDTCFEMAMERARALRNALETNIRFYPLLDESAVIVESNKP